MSSGQDDILQARPLTGRDHETTLLYLPLESDLISSAEFPLPDAAQAGDFVAGRLLRNAARLSLSSSASPFRSLGHISVRPRPYQFVPLIMALRQERVRLLIADDVGIGKTIEAGLIAREMLDCGDARRLCVLCPPYLCEQWRRELSEKFNLDARVVRPGTLARLERELPRRDLSIYQHFSCLVISIDFIKGQRRRYEFLAEGADLVIVDEAHGCARPRSDRGGRSQQQRYELVSELAKDPDRHLLLLTATPHSGIEESFKSLLGLLKPEFEELDFDAMPERDRRHLARHFVQRRRVDIAGWLGEETRFPERVSNELDYRLSPAYRELFNDVLAFARERVLDPEAAQHRQRVRYWAAVSLLRCLMSSPKAAVVAFTRRERAAADEEEVEETEEQRRREVLDPIGEDGTLDVVPEAAVDLGARDLSDRGRRRLAEFRKRAEAILASGEDDKLNRTATAIEELLRDGFRPIVYCRFIPTAHYVAERLLAVLQSKFKGLHVVAITGEMDPEQREAQIEALGESPSRLLVATDCLSEGINLQDRFDAVVHYDLPWNPNRLEQREGRVDRFGQTREVVRVITVYGRDNPIDGAVLQVLIRKAREIRSRLGVSIPVPVDSESVVEAIVSSLLLRSGEDARGQLQLELDSFEDFHPEWERAGERERISRTRFAQHAIKPDEVAQELEAVDTVLGDPDAVREFLLSAGPRLDIQVTKRKGSYRVDASEFRRGGWQDAQWPEPLSVTFEGPSEEGIVVIGRHHPLVAAMSDHVLGEAFRPDGDRSFARCGAALTDAVQLRSALLLLRARYRLTQRGKSDQFAEEILTTGFRRDQGELVWLAPGGEEVEVLLEEARPVGNLIPEERQRQVEWALELVQTEPAQTHLRELVDRRARELEQSHANLRQYTGGGTLRIEPYDPDLLGIYVFVPGEARR